MTLLVVWVLYAIGLSIALARNGHRGSHRGTPAAAGAPAQNPTRVLIVGATGGTGRQLVAQALERGWTVTALVRDPARLRMEHPSLTAIRGDVLDAASIEAAVRGQDAVLSALGHKRYFAPTRILSDGTRNILGAMQTHRVQRLVCETSLGIGDSAGRMGLYYTLLVIPLILPLYFWDKTRQEKIIAASGLDWVIVRPGALTDGARRGSVRHGRGIGSFLWTVRISRGDVAAFMLDQVTSNVHLRSAVSVA